MARSIFLIISLFICLDATAQEYSFSSFDDTTKSNEGMMMNQLINTGNGGVLMCGGEQYESGIVVSMDANGTINWSRRYDSDFPIMFNTIFAYDSVFYIGGYITDSTEKGLLLKIDASGNVLSSTLIDGINKPFRITKIMVYKNQLLLSCERENLFILQLDASGNLSLLNSTQIEGYFKDFLADGDFLYVVGATKDFECDESLGLMGKLASDGHLLWMRDYKIQSNEHTKFISASLSEDHSIDVFANAVKVICFNGRIMFAKLDTSGFELFKKEYANEYFSFRNNVIFRKNDSTFLSSSLLYDSYNENDTSLLLVEYNKDFNINFSYRYYHPDYLTPQSMVSTPANSIVTAGYVNFPSNPIRGFILKMFGDGSSCNQFPVTLDDYDHELIITSHSFQSGDTLYQISAAPITTSEPFTFKDECSFLTSVAEMHANSSISFFPNPMNREATLTCKLEKQEDVMITIYNSQGNVMWQLLKHNLGAGSYTQHISDENLPAGIYTAVIFTDETATTLKFEVVKE